MIRFFDIFLSLFGIFVGFPLFLFIYFIGWLDTGSPLFFQERFGKNQKIFLLIKFRTMRVGCDALPTHLMSSDAVTFWGSFLRKTKMDELPQLWNVLKGDMSLVGPRPVMVSQLDVAQERLKRGVYLAKPGITGLSQVRKIDTSNPILQAKIDALMIKHMNLSLYFKLLFWTLLGRGGGDKIIS